MMMKMKAEKENKKRGWLLTNIHGRFHETLLPGSELSQQLLLSLPGSLTSKRNNIHNVYTNSHW